ncbi:uncharacterized protein LOC124814918 [Hydra vulgaris]|uniref:uncharacterized protein LOC124814918 n=1 Tax=Hydra vulgaris TaxID=6087 RepID=UPI001F5EB703|nr:uncharacterized protein LOC124814918 [Hydra vulgaris]
MLLYGDFNFSHTSYEFIEVNGGIVTVAHVRDERQGDIRFQKYLDECHLTQLVTFPTYRSSRHVEPTSTANLIITHEPDRAIFIEQSDSLEPEGPLPAFEKRTEAICVVDSASFSIDIVQKCLYHIDERKSTGYDGLHPRVLSKCATSFAKPLSLIYKCLFATGVVPDLWRKSNVTPIFKKKSKINAPNYRPISLTSFSCKIIESILKTSIMEHCVANDLITPKQHGFVYCKGCVSNLLETRDIMTEAINRSHAVDVIYTDFNKVSHKRLLHKLRAYGIQDLDLSLVTRPKSTNGHQQRYT